MRRQLIGPLAVVVGLWVRSSKLQVDSYSPNLAYTIKKPEPAAAPPLH
jgi:hypothetical protein